MRLTAPSPGLQRPGIQRKPSVRAPAAASPAAAAQLRLQEAADASPHAHQLRQLQALAHHQISQLAGMEEEEPRQAAGMDEEEPLQGAAMEEEEPLQGAGMDEEEPLQGGGMEDEEPIQGKFSAAPVPVQRAEAPAANNTGMPDNLKAGVESLSGMDLSAVRVHRNSPEPAKVGAHAYAQGTDIHLASGQEQHLPHEAWHVVQQAQGRVQPTRQAKGVAINDDTGLEREADVMGAKAMQAAAAGTKREPLSDGPGQATAQPAAGQMVVQRRVGFEYEIGSIRTSRWNGGFVQGNYQPMAKGDRLATGTGFTVEADEDAGSSDLEFVTTAFPVTVAGFNQMSVAVNQIADIALYIERYRNQRFSAWWLPHVTAAGGRYVNYSGADPSGTPQATVGLSLSGLDELFRDIGPNALAAPAAAATPAQELFGGGLHNSKTGASAIGTSAQTTGIPSVAAARTAANTEITAPAHALPPAAQTPELRALVTQLVLYLVTGFDGVSGYGKTIAVPFMMRTDFGTVFGALPGASQNAFTGNPAAFVQLVCDAARHMRPGIANGGDVFEGGIYQQQVHGQPAAPLAQQQLLSNLLTRQAWLTGIVNGQDQLTRAHFPAPAGPAGDPQRAEIESLGGMGNQMDALGGVQNLPILEFRGLPRILPGLFPAMAMDIFRYVFALNTAAGTGDPGDLQAIGMNDRIDMATNNPAAGWFEGRQAWNRSATEQAANRAARLQVLNMAQGLVAAWGVASGGD